MKPIKLSVVKPGNQKSERPSSMAASETRYRRLFESTQDGILILDAGSGMVIDVNPLLVRMLGFSKAEICGKELWELGFFKDIAAEKSNFKELQRKKHIRYDDLPLETAGRRKFRVEFVSNGYMRAIIRLSSVISVFSKIITLAFSRKFLQSISTIICVVPRGLLV